MKEPMSWHKSCLANMKRVLDFKAKAILQAQKDHQLLLEEVTAYEAQIAKAEARGLNGFDAERFGKKKDS